MSRKYTVLRDSSRMSTAEPFGRSPFALPSARDLPEPQISTEDLSARDVRDVARAPEVMGLAPVMPTRLVEPVEMPGQAAATSTWGVSAVGADESQFTGAGVRPAVLDTGIEATHPAFEGVALEQRDFTGSGNGDRQGHGTHVAGTIFGRDVDGLRIGVARGVTSALIGKVLGDDGSGDSDMIFRAIQWAVNSNADIISMSLGFDFPGFVERLVESGLPIDLATSIALEGYRGNLRVLDSLMAMIQAQAAFGREVLVVAAAGNESRRNENPDFEIAVSIPAAAEGVISVGALGETPQGLTVAFFSNTLPQVSAPGVGVISAALGGGTRALNGTSMACPHVSGVAALWWEAVRQMPIPATARNVTSKLFASARADAFGANVDIADRGAGLVRAP